MRDADGGMPLHDAAAGGYVEIVRMLLEAAAAAGGGVSAEVVNAADGDGRGLHSSTSQLNLSRFGSLNL